MSLIVLLAATGSVKAGVFVWNTIATKLICSSFSRSPMGIQNMYLTHWQPRKVKTANNPKVAKAVSFGSLMGARGNWV